MSLPFEHVLQANGGELWLEQVPLSAVANAFGTPTYVYSRRYIEDAVAQFHAAFAATNHQLHYAVKANSNLAILSLFKSLGAGFDIVSGGELSRLLAIDADPKLIIFSGVGKSVAEIDFALQAGIGCFNVESASELTRLAERAELLQQPAPVSVRVNPDVDANTHPYISTGLRDNKFGVPIADAIALYETIAQHPYLKPVGIDCHIGSQISRVEPMREAFSSLLDLVDQLAAMGISLEHIDVGGGFGVTYQNEVPFDIEEYGASIAQMLGARTQTIVFEPGRSLVANAGVLLTRVEYLKPASYPDAPNFAVVDAAMNDLIRPALYQAWHDVRVVEAPTGPELTWDIVGPVCESGDFIAKQRPLTLTEGALLGVCSAGAYGMVQASNYNTRGRPCEVLVDGDDFRLIRRRETIQDQLRLEMSEQQGD